MNGLNPQPPFVWPEPRVLEGMCSYEQQPPYGELAREAQSLFGIVLAITAQGVDGLKFAVCIIVFAKPYALPLNA